MLVYLSWSGEPSHAVAQALRKWLPRVIQAVDTWMSSEDIEKGTIWVSENAVKLKEATVGVLCLTPENIERPWISFEAGALLSELSKSRVCPYLLRMRPAEIAGPLSQLQLTTSDENDTYKLVQTVNSALDDKRLDERRLEDAFKRYWPDLKEELGGIPDTSPARARRGDSDILEEILSIVRKLPKDEQDRPVSLVRGLMGHSRRPLVPIDLAVDPFFRSGTVAEYFGYPTPDDMIEALRGAGIDVVHRPSAEQDEDEDETHDATEDEADSTSKK